ncbi:MAG: cupin domain-containing protein [Comamonas testosteroni]|uniref:cupin domain-containing protein n=1 Tax=Comamonas testosteroni TaxID=285 RepID=UPI003D117FF0
MAVSISSPAKDRGQQVPINLVHKIGLIRDHWQPRVVAEMNDYQFKVVKIAGDFIWHAHGDTDEAFIVLEGVLRIDFRDHSIELQPGEMAVVPRGVERKTFAAAEAKLLMIEPIGVPNTGDSDSKRRAPNDVWI